MPTSPESAVKRLSRLPPNCVCANCGTRSKYGFSTVCVKYLTFVCNACKSSHQAVSHRCKSLTMSSWDQGEVLRLKAHGNDFARRVWLATAPAVGTGGRPREGDDINLFKRFVIDVYEHKRYYREPPRSSTDVSFAGEVGAGVALSTYDSPPDAISKQRARPPPPKPKPKPSPAVDLLDFGAFDAAAPEPPASNSTPSNILHRDMASNGATAAAAVHSEDPFFDPFHSSRADKNNCNGQSGNSGNDPSTFPAPSGPHQSAATILHRAPTKTNNNTAVLPTSEDPFFIPFGSNVSGASNNNCNRGSNSRNDVSLFSTPSGSHTNHQGSLGNAALSCPAPSYPSVGAFKSSNSSFDPFGGSSSSMIPVVNYNNSGSSEVMMTSNNLANRTEMKGHTILNNDSGNAMMMNGHVVMNSSIPLNGAGAMIHNSSNGNATMMMNAMVAGQTNIPNRVQDNSNAAIMNSNNNCSDTHFMASSSSLQQQPYPTQPRQLAMKINVMQPPNNTINSSFGDGFGAMPHSSNISSPGRPVVCGSSVPSILHTKEKDPFAGLGF